MTSQTLGTKIFMTGASGYIGSVISEFAVAEGYNVTGLSRSEKSDEKMRSLGVTPVRGDLSATDVLTSESSKADIVIHLADPLLDNLDKDYSVVVKIDNTVIDAIAKGLNGTGKSLIVASGSLVTAADPDGKETDESSPLWEKPLNERIKSEQYALSKASQNIRVIALRLAPFVYGRGGSGVRLFMFGALQAGKVSYVGEGSAKTTTVHVDDAARLFLLAAKKARSGQAYNATYETNVTFKQLAETMGQTLGLPVVSKTLSESEAEAGPFFTKFLSTENRASNAKAIKELGWAPQEKGILVEIINGSYAAFKDNIKA